MGEKITSKKVAEYFLSKEKLSPKKIQKLVYYAYAWFIVLNNQDPDHIQNVLFAEEPEAWLHGPVFPSLYNEYKEYGWNSVPKHKKVEFEDKELPKFLDKIWKVFGKYSADDLEYMTHQEDPWKKAREGASPVEYSRNKISKKEIFIYYNELSQE